MDGARDDAGEDVETVCLRSDILSDRWKDRFGKFEPARVMTMDEFVRLLCSSSLQQELDSHTIQTLWQKCVDHTRSTVTYQQFVNVISNRRNTSFTAAVDRRDVETTQEITKHSPAHDEPVAPGARLNPFRTFLGIISSSFLLSTTSRRDFVEHYKCWPPPVFIPIVSLIELGCFIPYKLSAKEVWTNGPVPMRSYFIYRPDKRSEIWRYMLYPLATSGWIHLAFNLLVQLMVGIPLEMVHGSLRVGFIYLAATLAGSLTTSLFDHGLYLVGASSGAYALLFAQFTFTITNFTRVKISYFPLPTMVILSLSDLGYAVWTRYTAKAHRLTYTSHLTGMFLGASLGCIILIYYRQKLYKRPSSCVAIAAYIVFVIFAIFWNVFYLK